MQKSDNKRLNYIKNVLDQAGIRFQVVEVSKRTGFSKGQVSSTLNGKIPVSEQFYKKFNESFKVEIEAFGKTDTDDVAKKTLDASRAFSQIIEEMILLKASIKVIGMDLSEMKSKLNKTSFAHEALELEKRTAEVADRLFDEWKRKG